MSIQTSGSQTIETIAVIGAGTMGHGIAQVAALAGFKVLMSDPAELNILLSPEAYTAQIGQ